MILISEITHLHLGYCSKETNRKNQTIHMIIIRFYLKKHRKSFDFVCFMACFANK
jgi:hypothetical protein